MPVPIRWQASIIICKLKSNLINSKFTYTETGLMDDQFYKNNYYDTVKTIDSSHVRRYVNDISYSALRRNKSFGWSLGYLNEISSIWQRSDTSFTNHISHAEAVFRTERKAPDSLSAGKSSLESKLSFNYVFAGVNQGNYKLESNSLLEDKNRKRSSYFIDLLLESRNADHMQRHWRSNHFIWDNKNFKSIQQFQLKAGFPRKRF